MKIYLAGDYGRKDLIPYVIYKEEVMKIYLAGGVSGNLKPAWNKAAEYKNVTPEIFERALRYEQYLVDGDPAYDSKKICGKDVVKYKPLILESFYYVDDVSEKLIPFFGDYMLDSGAFTFMQNEKSHLSWEEYIERYGDFVKRNKIKHYFELDIDSVVGYDKVIGFRKRLERITGSQCIPVWHKSRGKKEFLNLIEDYKYVAIGGIVSKEIKREEYKFFPWFIDQAHNNNCKIHGLGFTNLNGLKKYHFDSVDSTAWTTGNRFGHIYKFDGRTIVKLSKPDNKRMLKPRTVALINYVEWIKFQKYAEENL